MKAFEVIGGKRLQGEIVPQGAKNEALQILSAVLLTPEPVTINNIPDILDVNLLIDLLEDLGVKVNRIDRHTCVFEARDVQLDKLEDPEFQKNSSRLRGSVMIAGPLLARYKKAFIPKPGGDKIGRRRLDTHIIGFEKLGVRFEYEQGQGFFRLIADELKGTDLLLDEPL
jgi:UDP-N-acetylglucosamine 1-carboxyvinyltransferase